MPLPSQEQLKEILSDLPPEFWVLDLRATLPGRAELVFPMPMPPPLPPQAQAIEDGGDAE